MPAYYPNVPQLLRRLGLLALAMTLGITAAVIVGQDDYVALMSFAIVGISLGGAVIEWTIFNRSVITVSAL